MGGGGKWLTVRSRSLFVKYFFIAVPVIDFMSDSFSSEVTGLWFDCVFVFLGAV